MSEYLQPNKQLFSYIIARETKYILRWWWECWL